MESIPKYPSIVDEETFERIVPRAFREQEIRKNGIAAGYTVSENRKYIEIQGYWGTFLTEGAPIELSFSMEIARLELVTFALPVRRSPN